MPYQNVGSKCRFYIDHLQTLNSIGSIKEVTLDPESVDVNISYSGLIFGLHPDRKGDLEVTFNDIAPVGYDFYADMIINLDSSSSISMADTVRKLIDNTNFMSFLGHGMALDKFTINDAYTPTSLSQRLIMRVSYGHSNTELGFFKPSNEIINFNVTETAGMVDGEGYFYFTHCNTSLALHEVSTSDSTTPIEWIKITFAVEESETESSGDFVAGMPFSINNQLNSFAFGHYYDLSSPDMKLSMEVEFDGVTKTESLGGKTFNNTSYVGPPMWGEYPPWAMVETSTDESGNVIELIGPSQYRRRGRRSWNLKFRAISDEDLFSANYMSNILVNNADVSSRSGSIINDSNDLTVEVVSKHKIKNDAISLYDNNKNSDFYYGGSTNLRSDGRDSFDTDIFTDDSFHAKVLNYIGNGERFIFQPDYESAQPSDFAICTLDQKSLKISQVAHQIYDISLNIRETW